MNKYIEQILQKCPWVKQEELLEGKMLTNKGKVLLEWVLAQEDPYGNGNPQDALQFCVYCKDMKNPTEIDKVIQFLDKSDSCELYWIIPDISVWGNHNTTLFMPDNLRKKSEERDWSNRWDIEWRQAMQVYILGTMSDMVNNNLLDEEQVVQMIESEVTK
jgi:hypothetical protein